MADTPNHGYNVPAQGTQNWHQPLNQNFADFDVDIELRDVESNLSNYTPAQGAKFLATDSGVVYVGDGQSWVGTFVVPGYDPSADEAQFGQAVVAPTVETAALVAPLLSTSNGPLTLAVDGARVLEATAESGGDAGNVVAGHSANTAGPNVVGATIGGGGFDDGTTSDSNTVTGDYSTVGGGRGNAAPAEEAVVGGGERNTASGYYATVAGGANNDATEIGATVGGGGGISGPVGNNARGEFATVAGGEDSQVTADYGTVGGGRKNNASGQCSTVAGGDRNSATGKCATVGGGGPSDPNNPAGTSNSVYGDFGTIGGGADNQVGALTINLGSSHATVGGGESNDATGSHATVPGGQNNVADGDWSFAAGRYADTDGKSGSFVWGDGTNRTIRASEPNSITFQTGGSRSQGTAMQIFTQSDASTGIRLTAGSGSWTSLSSKTVKTNREPVDPTDALERVESLGIDRWEYETQEGVEHMGPMAEEFHEAFGLGADPEGISTVDADGVALAAIKGLSERLDERDERIEELEAENDALRERLSSLEDRVDSMAADASDAEED